MPLLVCHHFFESFYSVVHKPDDVKTHFIQFPDLQDAHSGRCLLSTERNGASFFEVIFARPIEPLSLLDFSLLFSMYYSHSAAKKSSEKDSAVLFCTFIDKVVETAIVSFYTARWTPIANNLQEFFVHAVLFPDS